MAFGDEHDYKNFPELSNQQLADYGFSSPHVQITEDFRATVVKVIDGDTMTLRTDFRDFDFPLRLALIDAPELNAGGEIAKEFVKSLIEGEEVEIKINVENRVGKYGRLIGRIEHGGLDIGEAQIRLGLVKPFGFKSEGEPQPIDKIFRLEQWF